MNWKKIFGDDLYSKVYEYAKKKEINSHDNNSACA